MQDVLKTIVGIRGRDKKADLKVIANLYLTNAYVRQGLGDVATWTLEALSIPRPPTWETKKWYRLNCYVRDLLVAVPSYLTVLVEADA